MAFAPSPVSAQEQEPLRLVYVNMGDRPAIASFHAVEDMIEETGQVDLVHERHLWRAFDEHGFDEEILAYGQRREHEDELAALMWEIEVEGILIHNVSDRRDNLNIAVIGPRGWTMTEVDHRLDVGELDDAGTMTVLQEIFSILVPEVRGFRRDVADGTLTDSDFTLPEPADEPDEPDEPLDIDPDDDLDDDREPGALSRNLSARGGLLIGHRAMTLDQPEGSFSMTHNTVLVGPALRIDGLVASFKEDTMAIEVGGFFGFSPFATIFGEQELSGQYMRVGAEARYLNTELDEVTLRGIAGAETVNITLETNDNYTGHGYLFGRLGGGATYMLDELVTFELDVLFMPIVTASNSGGAYGESSGWLGAGIEAGIFLEMVKPFVMSLDYGFHFFNTDYPEPTAAPNPVIDEPAQARDMYHQVMLTFGYEIGI